MVPGPMAAHESGKAAVEVIVKDEDQEAAALVRVRASRNAP